MVNLIILTLCINLSLLLIADYIQLYSFGLAGFIAVMCSILLTILVKVKKYE